MALTTLEEHTQNVRLQIHQPNGLVHHIGNSGPLIEWHLHKPRTLKNILKHPAHHLGSSYVSGEWDIDTRQLPELIQALVAKKSKPLPLKNLSGLRRWHAPWSRSGRAEKDPHWQESSAWLSKICLGEELFQGLARYTEPGMTLEQAQRVGCHRLLMQLQLQPGQHILDLNAGWGSLALFLAQQADIRVTAIVPTHQQLQFAQKEALRRGLDGYVHFRVGDFHRCRGRFDRILAIGFFEQHPEPSYPHLFQRLEELLLDDGFAWIQSTGRSKDIALSNLWYQGQLPARHSLPLLSATISALDSTHLRTLQLEDQTRFWLRHLENQGQRFSRHRTEISRRFGESCTRRWEFMLASQITAVRWLELSCHELLLGNTRCAWPAPDRTVQTQLEGLPPDLANTIPGLARDI